MGIPEGEEKRKGDRKCIWRNYGWKLAKPKETDIQIQEVQRVPNKVNPKRPIPRHIIINMAKVKERILKAAKEKQRVN